MKEVITPVPYLIYYFGGFLVLCIAYYFSVAVERSSMDFEGVSAKLLSQCSQYMLQMTEQERLKLTVQYNFRDLSHFSNLPLSQEDARVAESIFIYLRVVCDNVTPRTDALPFTVLSTIAERFSHANLSVKFAVEWRPYESVQSITVQHRKKFPQYTADVFRALELSIQHRFRPDFNSISDFREWLIPVYVFLFPETEQQNSTDLTSDRSVSCSKTNDGVSSFCIATIDNDLRNGEAIEAGIATMIARMLRINSFSDGDLLLFHREMNLRACDMSLRYLSLQQQLLSAESGLPMPGALAPLFRSIQNSLADSLFVEAFFYTKQLVFNKALLPQLYMSLDQQFAIHAPLFLSMLVAIIAGFIRWIKTANNKDETG